MNNVLYNNMSHQQLKSTVFIHSQGLFDSGLIQENLQGISETFNIIFTSFNHVTHKDDICRRSTAVNQSIKKCPSALFY